GAHCDVNDINGLVEEMYSGRTACEEAKRRLWNEAIALVDRVWPVIEALAQTLLKKDWKSQAPPSGERKWSTQLREKKMDGREVVELLKRFQISVFTELGQPSNAGWSSCAA